MKELFALLAGMIFDILRGLAREMRGFFGKK
jgi:hypothetical protein